MTNEEAVKLLEKVRGSYNEQAYQDALDLAIEALHNNHETGYVTVSADDPAKYYEREWRVVRAQRDTFEGLDCRSYEDALNMREVFEWDGKLPLIESRLVGPWEDYTE